MTTCIAGGFLRYIKIMTVEMQKEIVKALFNRNSKLFFNNLESATEINSENNPFLIEIDGKPDR